MMKGNHIFQLLFQLEIGLVHVTVKVLVACLLELYTISPLGRGVLFSPTCNSYCFSCFRSGSSWVRALLVRSRRTCLLMRGSVPSTRFVSLVAFYLFLLQSPCMCSWLLIQCFYNWHSLFKRSQRMYYIWVFDPMVLENYVFLYFKYS